MPESLPLPLIGAFTGLVFFSLAQATYSTSFKGEAAGIQAAATLSALLGVVVGLIYLAYYGYSTAWYWPFALLAIGVVSNWLLRSVAVRIADPRNVNMTLGLIGFIGWPAAAILAFILTPGD